MSHCQHCGAGIGWIQGPDRKWVPVGPRPERGTENFITSGGKWIKGEQWAAMTEQKYLDGLDAVRSVVEGAPAEAEFASKEIGADPCRDLLSVYVEGGIEAFRKPVGFLPGTENFNWFGFLSGEVLVY